VISGCVYVNKMSARRGNLTSWESPTLNSLECWDYSIELECLQGPEGKTNLFLYNLVMAYDIFTVCAADRNKLFRSKILFYLCFVLRQLNTCTGLNVFLPASPSSYSSSDSSSCSFRIRAICDHLSFPILCARYSLLFVYRVMCYIIFLTINSWCISASSPLSNQVMPLRFFCYSYPMFTSLHGIWYCLTKFELVLLDETSKPVHTVTYKWL
jgi:hypothetical protein